MSDLEGGQYVMGPQPCDNIESPGGAIETKTIEYRVISLTRPLNGRVSMVEFLDGEL